MRTGYVLPTQSFTTADKSGDKRQHYRMRVICPHCQTIYQLRTLEPDAVLVCHRCGTEFGMGEKPEGAQPVDTASLSDTLTPDMFAELRPEDIMMGDQSDLEELPIKPATDDEQDDEDADIEAADIAPDYEASEAGPDADKDADNSAAPSSQYADMDDFDSDHPVASTRSSDEDSHDSPKIIPADHTWWEENAAKPSEPDEASTEDDTETSMPSPPPPRSKARIMPWLLAVVMLIAGSGFWLNHEAWLDDPWLRSVLLNAGIEMEIRDKDWHIDPNSVSATWLEREGGATVLVITGEILNKLQTDLLPPLVHFTLYARDNPDELILERDLIITRPPLMQAIRQAPYSPPPRDDMPITALGKRGFILVLEDLPQNAGNFSLLAKAR